MSTTTNNTIRPSALLLVGNGFDRALGYQTGYKDFLSSDYFQDEMSTSNELCKALWDHKQYELWVDLENGLYEYSKNLIPRLGDAATAEMFKNDFLKLREALFNYLVSIQGEAPRLDTIEEVENRERVQNLLLLWNKMTPQIVSFNYTILLQGVSIIGGFDQHKVIFPHGSIYNDKDDKDTKTNTSNEIVFGIDDCQKVNPLHGFLYKSLQYYSEDIERFKRCIDNSDIYIVFGCSMGDSDATYFKRMFDKEKTGKHYLIYGYGKDGIETIEKNISKYINDMDAFRNANKMDLLDCSTDDCLIKTKDFIEKTSDIDGF